ncbi:Dihydrofolate reductase protein [Dioscorea alata]|uniref:Dihydrofolate reductase protein n=2 Tax=Dioscorea alata TaxID=55571 RepID=A0ACB7VXW6_DIOAL|nr:Dihydrofolate reductase protein [Dioscorea alata]KAH7679641.1 Dihydrofolate reductase protein [Dioscorea alata]
MGSLAEEIKDHVKVGRKPRILCLHGFRTSGEIMKRQVIGKWPATVTSRLDLIFPDAPWPAAGKSDVEGFFDPPYYEWFQFDEDYMHYVNLDECFEFIEDLIIKHGPIDGLMGFSQGAILSAALAGMQEKGLALTRVPKLKFVVIIGGAKFPSPTVAEKAYSTRISCPSLHFIGAEDFLHSHGKILLESFVDPLVIHHPKGHTVPRLDPKNEEMAMSFIDKIEKTLTSLDAPKDEQEEHPILV